MKNVNKIWTTLSLSASDTREDTIKSIIRTTLKESRVPVTLNELKENIDIVYDITLYDVEFETIIKSMLETGEVYIDSKLRYDLSDDEKEKLLDIEAKIRSSEAIRSHNFRLFINEKARKKVDDVDITLLWETLKQYFYGCFFQYGIKAIELISPKNPSSETNTLNGEVYNTALKKLGKPELNNLFKIAVDQFPDYATSEDLDFIDEIGQKTLSFASLGLSPEQARDDLDKELIDWTLYLDTNFLFSILDLHTNSENDACKELLKLVALNKDIIKIRFRYSELTLKELRHKKDDFKNLDETLTNSAIKAILKSDDLDDFARKYYLELLNQRDDAIHPSRIIDLAEIRLPNEEIYISRNNKLVESFNENYINECIVDYQSFINDINERKSEFAKTKHVNFRPYYRSDSQLVHDITLRELIIGSRRIFKKDELKTFNEVKYFGLTLDELLLRYDTNKVTSISSAKYPTFFRPSFLLNKLVKLLPIKTPDYKKAFLKAVSSRGFYKEQQKSNEIIQIASYLKKHGIDNESVIFNLISEKLFMDKYRQESTKNDFNSDTFFESELNNIFNQKEKEIQATKAKLTELDEITKKEKEEKEKLRIQNEEKQSDLTMLNTAIIQLNKQIKILEERSTKNVSEPVLNFEAAEMISEINTLKTNLNKERKKNIEFSNDQRKFLRNKYIKKNFFWWRFKSFIWIIALPLLFLFLYLIFKDSSLFPDKPIERSIDFFLTTTLVKGLLVIITIIYQAIFISIFTSKFFQTNVSKFEEHIEIPIELKEINE